MRASHNSLRHGGVAVLAIVAAACAAEAPKQMAAPVALEPGLYEVSQAAAAYGRRTKADKGETLCFRAGREEELVRRLAIEALGVHSTCRGDHEPRSGNVFAGAYSCIADRKMAYGANRMLYRGEITADAVIVEGRYSIDATLLPGAGGDLSDKQLQRGLKAMERIKIIVEAKRVGDCR